MIKPFTLGQLAKRYGGRVSGPDYLNYSVSTDTRTVKASDVFVALKGERFDAHDHIQEAIEKGVRALVVEQGYAEKHVSEKEITVWSVSDTTEALGHIAQYQRDHFMKPVIGITGSSGKTSVKGMLASILACYVGQDNVFATKGNLNNHIGVPLSLLSIEPRHQYAVIEMGASAVGEIAYLSSLAKPTVAMVNNVMSAHVEGFGSVDAIATAKGEIYQGLHINGCAVVNGEDKYAGQWLARIQQQARIIFSATGECDQAKVAAHNPRLLKNGCYSFSLSCGNEAVVVKLNILGRHNIANAVAAAACAHALGMDVQFIRKGLEQFNGEKGRLQIVNGINGCTLIDDSYNANPGSMRAAIDVLADASSNTVMVMGDMAELGSSAAQEHQEIGRYIFEKKIKHFFTVGEYSRLAAEAYGKGAIHCSNVESLLIELETLSASQPVMLVKGSRSSRMERVIHALSLSGDNNAGMAC